MQGQLLGTPAYMAPEQAQGRHDLVDQRTDIYGLGAILYEILTGRPPFVAPKTSEVIRKVCQEAPDPAAPDRPGDRAGPGGRLPEGHPQGEGRPLPDGVRAGAGGPPLPGRRAGQGVRRALDPAASRGGRAGNRTKVAAAAALLVTATIALGVSTVLVSRERNEAEAQGQQARQAVHLLTKVADIGFDDQLDPLQKEMLENALAYYEQFTSRVVERPGGAAGARPGLPADGRHPAQAGPAGATRRPPIARRSRCSSRWPAPPARGARRSGRWPGPAPCWPTSWSAAGPTRARPMPLYAPGPRGAARPGRRQAGPGRHRRGHPPPGPDLEEPGRPAAARRQVLAEARPVYDQAIAELERAAAADAKHAEARNELALAIDARGWIHRELGDLAAAEADYRRAVEMLEKLVAEFPTVPRHREALARALQQPGPARAGAPAGSPTPRPTCAASCRWPSG